MADQPVPENEAGPLSEKKEQLVPVQADLVFLLSLVFVALSVLNALRWYGDYPVLKVGEVLVLLCLCILPVAALLLWFVGRSLHKRWHAFPRSLWLKGFDSLAFGFLPLLGLFPFLIGAAFFVNGVFDSPDVIGSVSLSVSKVQVLNMKVGSEGCAVVLGSREASLLPAGLSFQKTETLPVSCRAVPYIEPGASAELAVRPGFLGIPWIDAYTVSFEVGQTRGRKGDFPSFLAYQLGFGWLAE